MKNKKFELPEAIIVAFDNEDIIFTSGPGWNFGLDEDDWQDDDD